MREQSWGPAAFDRERLGQLVLGLVNGFGDLFLVAGCCDLLRWRLTERFLGELGLQLWILRFLRP